MAAARLERIGSVELYLPAPTARDSFNVYSLAVETMPRCSRLPLVAQIIKGRSLPDRVPLRFRSPWTLLLTLFALLISFWRLNRCYLVNRAYKEGRHGRNRIRDGTSR